MQNYKNIIVYCFLATLTGSNGANASHKTEGTQKSFTERVETFTKTHGCPRLENFDCDEIYKKFEESQQLVNSGPDSDISKAQQYNFCRAFKDFCKKEDS